MSSPTPWRVDGTKLYDANGHYCGCLEGILNADRDLIVAAVNWYSSLPEEVRKMKPTIVELAVKAVQAVVENEAILHKSGPNIVREAIEAFEEIAKKSKEESNENPHI